MFFSSILYDSVLYMPFIFSCNLDQLHESRSSTWKITSSIPWRTELGQRKNALPVTNMEVETLTRRFDAKLGAPLICGGFACTNFGYVQVKKERP